MGLDAGACRGTDPGCALTVTKQRHRRCRKVRDTTSYNQVLAGRGSDTLESFEMIEVKRTLEG